MSFAAAKLCPGADKYITFDPQRPVVSTSAFEKVDYFEHTHEHLVKNGSDPVRTRLVASIASGIYGQIVKAIQEVSFVPRRNMASLALNDLQEYLDDSLVFDEASDNDEAMAEYQRKGALRDTLATLGGDPAKYQLTSIRPFSTLTPEIVSHAIRHALEEGLMQAGQFQLEQPESPVPEHNTLVNANTVSESAKPEDLAVMTPAAREILNRWLPTETVALIEEDLQILRQIALLRSNLSPTALARDAVSIFSSYPVDLQNLSADKIKMSTLNPFDWIKAIRDSRLLGDGRLGFEILTDATLRQKVLDKIQI